MNARMTQVLRASLFTALLLCSGATLAPVAAQDIAGHWILSVTLDAGSGDANFVFAVEDGKITGTYAGTMGEEQITGTIEDNVVTFGFESADAGEISFSGIVSRSMPSNSTSPSSITPGGFGINLIIDRALTLFPQPLSPTNPNVSP